MNTAYSFRPIMRDVADAPSLIIVDLCASAKSHFVNREPLVRYLTLMLKCVRILAFRQTIFYKKLIKKR